MNKKLEDFKSNIKEKKVAVLGMGISNTPLIKYLGEIGVDITAFDKCDERQLASTIKYLKNIAVKYSLGENYLENLKGFDVIFKTPVIRWDIPELMAERGRGAVITSEMEVFFELCPAQIFAVTGSDGKTTTTTLIYEMLKKQGYNCWLGGNIGTPLLGRIDEIKESDKVVVELSSFQLHTMKKSASVAVVTNISPNHLDIHKSMDEYVEAKRNIFKFQVPDNRIILNYDNEIARNFVKDAKGSAVFFSRTQKINNGTMIKQGKIVYTDAGKETEIVEANKIKLPGVHNVENYLAASAAVYDYVDISSIRDVALEFEGVEHRIEFVRELNGIKFYNDSIASSPSRTIAGLNSFDKKIILIAGGKDKNNRYDILGEVMAHKVKCLVLIGQTASKIEKTLYNSISEKSIQTDIKVIKCDNLRQAVSTAHKNSSTGDIIMLSPASTSFDMFKNFEERGKVFKEIVNKLGD